MLLWSALVYRCRSCGTEKPNDVAQVTEPGMGRVRVQSQSLPPRQYLWLPANIAASVHCVSLQVRCSPPLWVKPNPFQGQLFIFYSSVPSAKVHWLLFCASLFSAMSPVGWDLLSPLCTQPAPLLMVTSVMTTPFIVPLYLTMSLRQEWMCDPSQLLTHTWWVLNGTRIFSKWPKIQGIQR